MKVKTYESIDVEVEVDVDLNDVLVEFADAVQNGKEGPVRLLAAVDSLTRILARVTDDHIAGMTAETRGIIRQRLAAEMIRYAS